MIGEYKSGREIQPYLTTSIIETVDLSILKTATKNAVVRNLESCQIKTGTGLRHHITMLMAKKWCMSMCTYQGTTYANFINVPEHIFISAEAPLLLLGVSLYKETSISAKGVFSLSMRITPGSKDNPPPKGNKATEVFNTGFDWFVTQLKDQTPNIKRQKAEAISLIKTGGTLVVSTNIVYGTRHA